MLSGSGAGFSMGLILCLCGGLIACFALLSAQMRQPAPVVAVAPLSAADQAFNARYYPLIDCWLFRMPRGKYVYALPDVTLPEPIPDDLPTGDPCPKTPLYPRTPAVAPAADAQGAAEVR